MTPVSSRCLSRRWHADGDSPTSLATTLASFALARPELYTGSGDHLVSQAFYLDDPEGNGVELYADRPRDRWRWSAGRVAMDTLPLDPHACRGAHLPARGLQYQPGLCPGASRLAGAARRLWRG